MNTIEASHATVLPIYDFNSKVLIAPGHFSCKSFINKCIPIFKIIYLFWSENIKFKYNKYNIVILVNINYYNLKSNES